MVSGDVDHATVTSCARGITEEAHTVTVQLVHGVQWFYYNLGP